MVGIITQLILQSYWKLELNLKVEHAPYSNGIGSYSKITIANYCIAYDTV